MTAPLATSPTWAHDAEINGRYRWVYAGFDVVGIQRQAFVDGVLQTWCATPDGRETRRTSQDPRQSLSDMVELLRGGNGGGRYGEGESRESAAPPPPRQAAERRPSLLGIGHEHVLALAEARADVEDAELRLIAVYRAAVNDTGHLGDDAVRTAARRLGGLALKTVREEAYP